MISTKKHPTKPLALYQNRKPLFILKLVMDKKCNVAKEIFGNQRITKPIDFEWKLLTTTIKTFYIHSVFKDFCL